MNYNDLFEYNIGSVVYLKTDKDQCKRLVTAIQINGNGGVIYRLASGSTESWHYAFEITTEIDVMIKTDS